MDSAEDQDTRAPFVVQEHVPGISLAQALVPGEPRSWKDALRLVRGLGQALEPLHQAGLVHGEVRPGHVLLADGGVPKLADADLARLDPLPPGAVSVQEALYTSPEQAVGERVDARADIFALGALAYRLLTGHGAFEAETAQRILARVIHDSPRPPSERVPGLPPGVDDVVAKALAKARKDRYATVGAFCDDLDELLAGRPPRHAEPAPAPADPARYLEPATTAPESDEGAGSVPLRRSRRLVWRVAAGVVALALVAGLELLRREMEAPDAAPFGRPAVELERREEPPPSASLELPPLDEPMARLAVDFRHTLERGTLVVTVDGAKVLERQVSGAVKRSILGIKLREGRVREVIELPEGRHEIGVRVSWPDDRRSDALVGNFAAGATRRLEARVSRIGKRLSVEWN